MDIEIDNERLITLVEHQPVLWDKTLDKFQNRNKTLECWKQICRVLKDGYDEISKKEQNELGKQVKKRWTNIKDSFLRWLKKYNDTIRSGAAANTRMKKYVYHDQLLFLKLVAVRNETEDSLNDSINEKETVNDETAKRKKRKTNELEIQSGPERKDKHMAAFEERMIKTFEVTPTPSHETFKDRHMAFFAGIVPSLENFNEDQICDFQIGVLKLIQSLKRREISIPANNSHLRNDNFHFEEATPHTVSTHFRSSMPCYSYPEQTAHQTTSIPLHSYASTFHFRTGQEASQTPHNIEATYTSLPSTTPTSGRNSAAITEETNILSPSYSTLSSEDSKSSIKLFD